MLVGEDFRLETYFSRWEFKAKHHLSASDAESWTLRELLDMGGAEAAAAFDAQWLGYTETFGSPRLRTLIASTYERCDAEDVLCFAGAEEGLFVAAHALLDRGDHAIVVTPNYQAAETVPLSICEVSGVALDPEQNWALDPGRIAAAIRPNTRLVSINFPHNPTGTIIPPEALTSLIELCRAHGLWLLSDEVYRPLGPNPQRQLPQVADLYERGVSLNVLSKAYGLPGLRIGWIALRDRAALSRMERLKHYLSICNSAPSEALACIALAHRERIIARNNALLRDNLARIERFFGEFPALFEWYRPDGGCIAYPRYRGPGTVDAFADDLVEKAGVLILPAGIYRSALTPTPTDRFRVGYGRARLADALAAFGDYLRERYAA